MLVVVSVTVCLCVLAIVASAMVVRVATDRLGLDLMTALLWFGLAEWPSEEQAPREAPEEVDHAGRRQPRRRRRRSPAPSPGLRLGRLRGHRP